jgi:SAM-dependent methyltransferase
MKDIFTNIYKHNLWSGRQSRSGNGSDLEETVNIRRELPKLLRRLEIESMLDIPCGDFNWMKKVVTGDIKYIGADIVFEILQENARRYWALQWELLDITKDELPKVDLIFTRDCLGHLSNENVQKAVENIKRASPKYFVATHWPGVVGGPDIQDGSWRPINMSRFLDGSFELIDLIEEDHKDKYLGVWKLK